MADRGKEEEWEEMRGKQCLTDEGKNSSAVYLQSSLSVGPEECCLSEKVMITHINIIILHQNITIIK